MNMGLAIKLALAVAYVSFSAAALGSAAYLLFERSSRQAEVDALLVRLATTRVRVDLFYLSVGLCASIAAVALSAASRSSAGSPSVWHLVAPVLLVLYYAPVTFATAIRIARSPSATMGALAWFSFGGIVLVVIGVAAQFLL